MSVPALKVGTNASSFSASSPAASNSSEFQFERPDWVLFRSVATLSQKAGVAACDLRRLVLKELTDNALDSGASVVWAGKLNGSDSRYFVEDDGPGIAGEPEDIARLFSINRPLLSSKLWRLPLRGAMGNGLRVVVGAVAASGGTLSVVTRNRLHVLTPKDDRTTAVESRPINNALGTRIEIEFGPALPLDPDALSWAKIAIQLAAGGPGYGGKASPHWYDGDHFVELLRSAGGRSVRDLIANLDGCSGAKAGKIAAPFKGKPCNAFSREQALELLERAKAAAKSVRPERLGCVGALDNDEKPTEYAVERGTFETGARYPRAEIPFVVEVWADAFQTGRDNVALVTCVNRTPITGTIYCFRKQKALRVYGCGLNVVIEVPKGDYHLVVNVTTPYCPITTDGKEPDLLPFAELVASAVAKAIRRARKSLAAGRGDTGRRTQKSVVLDNLDTAIAKASGEGQYRFNLRQLFYVIRPLVAEELGAELKYNNFEGIITDYEDQNCTIAGLYRDPRGTLYHPHTRESIALGTIAVEEYERPEWTFNRVLYCEKEGLLEILKEAGWPERNDCALVSSKGFTTRAVRDLLDLLGDSGEPLQVFCIHDADAYGTLIYETLVEETKARPKRRVQVVNLGLEPWEAVENGLAVEAIDKGPDRRPVASYVVEREDGARWEEWLQTKRIELNEMTTPQFIAWLSEKMAQYPGGKVIPPAEIVQEEIETEVERQLREAIAERILQEAGLDEQLAQAVALVKFPGGDEVVADLTERLSVEPSLFWKTCTDEFASALVQEGGAAARS